MDKNKMSLVKVVIKRNLKDKLLTDLSNLGNVHIKKREEEIKKEEKGTYKEKIESLKKNLKDLFKKLNVNESSFLVLEGQDIERIEFKVKDLYELINQLSEEINFYSNRINELERYINKAKIELESIQLIKRSYAFLDKYNFNRFNISYFKNLDFRVYTTFTKNLPTLRNLFEFSEFPNVYQTQKISNDRAVFFVIYPRDKEEELRDRINLIHAEEVQILKKYLTYDGINFDRINKEIDLITKTLQKYEKEIQRIKEDNLVKFAALEEVINNLAEYNSADNQFRELPSGYLELEFFIPKEKKNTVEEILKADYENKIRIEDIDIERGHKVNQKEEFKKKAEKQMEEMEAEKEKSEKKRGKEKPPKKEKEEEKEKTLQETETEEDREQDVFEEFEVEGEEESEEEEEEKDLRDVTPRRIKHNKIIKPFETLVKMYGTPSYTEIDPTPILFITFPLLFGMMFGDLGHGIVLVISGIVGGTLFRQKESIKNFSWIIFYCGLWSMFFGFLYGEFFGQQEIPFINYELGQVGIPLPWGAQPIYLSHPLENVITLFFFTVMVGVIHINLGWFIQFLNYVKESKVYQAITEPLIKIWFLDSVVWIVLTYGIDIEAWLSAPYPILMVIIPGLLLMVLRPLGKLFGISYMAQESYSELISEGSIDTFETFLSVPSNVLSYVRLLALALAHISLMVAIQAIISIIPTGTIVTQILIIIGLIFGNAVIILLEGVIVFLNALRLHFYEFFFKFYKGSGIEYDPFFLNSKFSEIQFKEEIERDVITEEIEKEIETEKAKKVIENAKQYISKKYL
ncbi:MAG: V-type ATP synthase subunit I [Promethearchaeota archaeon]|nr:MAG: V-type ATP synthase subunit I [Candidatus Lokiarchaeota archaeon]